MKYRATIVAVISLGLFTGHALSHPLSRHETPVAAPLLHLIKWHRSETWRLQGLMGQPRTPSAFRERTIESLEYRSWQLGLWKYRHTQARQEWKAFLRSWQAQERNAFRAIRAAASFWRVSAGWLIACAQSEGLGNGGSILWTPNWAGAAGPFQFLSGTFEWMSNAAWSATARRGLRIPLQYKRWTSTVGQSWTAAWAFRNGYSYHWYGAGC